MKATTWLEAAIEKALFHLETNGISETEYRGYRESNGETHTIEIAPALYKTDGNEMVTTPIFNIDIQGIGEIFDSTESIIYENSSNEGPHIRFRGKFLNQALDIVVRLQPFKDAEAQNQIW